MFLPDRKQHSKLKHEALRRAMGFDQKKNDKQKRPGHRRAQSGARRISRESRQESLS